ncbi:MAG: hypothetical protein ACD_73C00218G0002 [uncultured bacterium]|nr:MAG: hypothetical protein ACD_73C00218G0002 [uncultured bacterium]
MFKEKLVKILASAFGCGYVPLAPGTVGSIPGILVLWLLADKSRALYWVVCILVAVLAIVVANEAEKFYGRKDAQVIVIDEVAGQILTFFLVPQFNLTLALIGFVAFRFFDVVKIFPANWVQDNMPGGYGVTGDDLVAGLQAGLLLYLIQLYILPYFA